MPIVLWSSFSAVVGYIGGWFSSDNISGVLKWFAILIVALWLFKTKVGG